jgi:hypothetical protein
VKQLIYRRPEPTMGNEQAKEPVMNFDALQPGQTIKIVGSETLLLGVVLKVDANTVAVTSLEKLHATTTTERAMALDEIALADSPRAPFESCYEEAAVTWLKSRVQQLVAEYEGNSVDEYNKSGPQSPKRRNSRRKSGILMIGANKVDAKKRTEIMLTAVENESLHLGFLTMSLPKTMEKRMDAQTWKDLDLDLMAHKIHESLVWRYERNAHNLLL